MTRGIYITANDRVSDHAIALLNSIRTYDTETPVVLIPYDDNYHNVAQILNDRFGVTVYQDLEFIERLSIKLQQTFGEEFFARPNQFRKLIEVDSLIRYCDRLHKFDSRFGCF